MKKRNTNTKSAGAARLTLRALTKADWPVIERLFGPNGACGGCWCMWWRVPMGGKTWDAAKGQPNRDRLREAVRKGKVYGMLAFAGDEPVGWCSFGPRSAFPRLERVKALQKETPADTWSIVCFYIPARWRGRGVATRLLEAATAEAFAQGAREVEGYPVPPKKDVVPAAFAWTGVPALFERAGYVELTRREASRPIFVKRRAKR